MRALLLLLAGCAFAVEKPYRVTFDVQLGSGQKGEFEVEVHPEWAPLGAARFKEMIDEPEEQLMKHLKVTAVQ